MVIFFNGRFFQKKFNGFYRVRRCSVNWQPQFFALLGKTIKEDLTFGEVLKSIHKNTGRYEASFASKLCATVYRTAPVIDSIVLAILELKLPYQAPKDAPTRYARFTSNWTWALRPFIDEQWKVSDIGVQEDVSLRAGRY